jgi:hypothetical protein
MKSNKQDLVSKIRERVQVGILTINGVLLFYLSALFLIPPQIAYFKSKNINNIKEGCLYFVGDDFKNRPIHRINGYNGSLYGDLLVTNSPADIKFKNRNRGTALYGNNEIWEKNYCYKAKYVHVHFLNKDFSYVYDFIN